MVNDMLVLYDSVTKGIKKSIRHTFLLFLVILFGAIILTIAFSHGWIKIVVTANGQDETFENEQGIYFEERSDEAIIRYFQRNSMFDIIRHSVEPGETLIDIENRYRTNRKVIQKLNRIDDPIRLTPGEVIWVPIKSMPS